MARMFVATVFLLIALLSVQVIATTGTLNLTSCGLVLNSSQDLRVELQNNVTNGDVCITLNGGSHNNLTIDCNGYSIQESGGWAFLYVTGANFTDLAVENCDSDGVWSSIAFLENFGSNVYLGTLRISNSVIATNPDGVAVDSSQLSLNILIENSTIVNPGNAGFLDANGIGNVTVTGSTLDIGASGAVNCENLLMYDNVLIGGWYPSSFLGGCNGEVRIYNNLINSSALDFASFADATALYFNTTSTVGTNIIGGSRLGGNYWANSSGTGYSETCAGTGTFCTTPYDIFGDASAYDYLPLTNNAPPQTDFNISACQYWQNRTTVNVYLTQDIVIPLNYSNAGTYGANKDGCLDFTNVTNAHVDCQGHSMTIEGIPIGTTSIWNGIYASNAKSPIYGGALNLTVENCIMNLTAAQWMGGVYAERSESGTRFDSTIRNNTVYVGFDGAYAVGLEAYDSNGGIIVIEDNIVDGPVGIYVNGVGSSPMNVTVRRNSVTSSGTAFWSLDSGLNSHTIYDNRFTGGLLDIGAGTYAVYDNIFNGTTTQIVGGTVYFNTTAIAGTNIAGGSQLGGNFWTNSTGGYSDTCTPSGSFCSTPYNIFGDGSFYDYLPLIAQCIPSWTCGAYNDLLCQYGTTQTCYIANDTNNCGVPYNGTFQEFGTQSCPLAASEFVGQGATTDFTNGTVFTQPVIEVPSVATIQWLGSNLNFTGANLDAHVDIGAGYISVDSIYLPDDLNTPAELTIVVPALQVPQVYRDGEKCGVCTNFSYDGTTATFVVPGFSNYSVGERFTYYEEDLKPIVIDGLGVTGAEIVSWLDIVVLGFVLVAIVGIAAKFSQRR